MKNLSHPNREKGHMRVTWLLIVASWGASEEGKGQHSRGKRGPATNLQGPAGARRVRGGKGGGKESARIV